MRSTLLATLAGMAVIGPLPAQHYKVEVTSTQNVSMAAMGMPDQQVKLTSTGFLTVTMSDTTGGRLAHVTIDSSTFDGGELMAQLDPATLGDTKGAAFHFYVVEGKIKDAGTPTVTNLRTMSLLPGVMMLFPAPKAGVKVGDNWTDTTRIDSTSAQGRVTGTNVTDWSVSGADGEALVLEGKVSGTTSIDMAMGQMSGSTSGTQHITSTPAGPAIAVDNVMQTDMSMAMGATGQPINIKGTSILKIIRLP
jgi:hypothetical protein